MMLWLDSDKELIEPINSRLTVSGANNPHLTHNLECVRCGLLILLVSRYSRVQRYIFSLCSGVGSSSSAASLPTGI